MAYLRRSRLTIVLTTSVAIAAAAAACSGDDGGAVASNSSGGSGAASGSGGSGTSGGPTDGSGATGGLFGDVKPPVPVAVIVEPPTATIDVDNGTSSPIQLVAKVQFDDGTTTEPTDVTWTIAGPPIADIDGTGSVTAKNTLGGAVTATASHQGLEGSSTIDIVLHIQEDLIGLTPADISLLENASNPDAAITWAYPYDETVFPQGLAPPELMWNGSAAGDAYLIHLSGKYAEVKHFTTADPPSRTSVAADAWQKLTESGPGGPVSVKVSRLSAGVATVAGRQTWNVADGELRGSVYYWANSLGRVLRIKPGAAAPDDFLANAGITGCSTCHTVSANGRRIVLGGDVAETTFDLKNSTTVLSNMGRPWAMPAVSADGTVTVLNNAPLPGPPGGSAGAFDTDTGTALAGTGLDSAFLWMPAFSADDKMIAYVGSAAKDLRVWDWDATLKQASNDRSLIPAGADPTWSLISFPTPAPDHRFVVYQRGNAASYDTRDGFGAFYITATDAPAEVRLERLNGDNYPFAAGDRDKNYGYEPVFAPLPAGGYYWVVFTSRRTYGNLLTGAKDAVKQLWVAAIDLDPQPGQDPSHPAFWLAGQDTGTLNMRGYWALDPCKEDGEACVDGSECCLRSCVTAADGTSMCGPPPVDECVQNGNACETDEDCCAFGAGIFCIAGICTQKGPS